MDANSVAWYWTETLKAVAGPAGGVVVSIYVIRRMFEVLDRAFALVERLAAKPAPESP